MICVASLALAAASLGGEVAANPGWRQLQVPGDWREVGDGELANHDGFGWYRCYVQIPENWARRWELTLSIEQLANAYEVYFNGERVAAAGAFPPDYADAFGEAHRHTIPAELVRRGERNMIALRVYSPEGPAGLVGRAPALTDYNREIVLQGPWQFHAGDDPAWAEEPEQPDLVPEFAEVVAATQVRAAPSVYLPGASLPPDESHAAIEHSEDIAVDLVLADPIIEQPLHMSFDERGRLWVVEYRQYPYPAGLRMVSRDIYWRAVWEPDLPPPPYDDGSPFQGRDRITVHEDTTGDGAYDSHETFVDGLNITTAVAHGRGGVWVLSPPHLLFYPVDDDGTTITGPPEVHLQGFGLEDTHSVANSLTWGPDGWLYAAQGSTVSGNVRRPDQNDEEATYSMGQNIWRYHPESRRYEIFAEGGGNAFGVEIDAKGRTFSGHNGGDTRGFHYVQGGYSVKGFGKHGPLSNPYTFGHFPAMSHGPVPRFTHTFLIYEADNLPDHYSGNLLGLEPMQGQVVHTRLHQEGSTFRTEDLERPIRSNDVAFRPVDIKLAPDGSVYIADFYSAHIAHGENYEGYLNREAGRIYRMRHRDAEPRHVDLAGRSADELVDLLDHENRWIRKTALRLLGDRRDQAIIPRLSDLLEQSTGQLALEALWALHLSGGFDDERAASALTHADAHVRRWAVRLLGDEGKPLQEALASRLAQLAVEEDDVEVRSQLASTARRLSAEQAVAIVKGLITHDSDATDAHLPLLIWWALEAHAGPESRSAVLAMFETREVWDRPLVVDHLLGRVMRRLAATGRRSDLLAGAQLFRLAPDRERSLKLMEGLERAFENRTVAGLPQELVEAIADAGVASRVLQVRQGDRKATAEALAILADSQAPVQQRLGYARLFGEVDEPRSVPGLLKIAAEAESIELRTVALASLRTYSEARIGERVVAIYNDLPVELLSAAHALLTTRSSWSLHWLEAIDAGRIQADDIPADVVEAMRLHEDEAVTALLRQHFIDKHAAPAEHVREEMQRLADVVQAGEGDPYVGLPIYAARCAACHTMFGKGNDIGPDLTSYQRNDLHALLRSIVDPNADVRDGYEGVIITTTDGRSMTGFLADQDDDTLVVRGLDGQDVALTLDQIADRRPLGRSLMPENLLTGLSDQQVRDLLAFLRSRQPISP
ncbi:MAG: PVC-type heme-binding CxxCH protein [Phycisphaeraceae bacterium]